MYWHPLQSVRSGKTVTRFIFFYVLRHRLHGQCTGKLIKQFKHECTPRKRNVSYNVSYTSRRVTECDPGHDHQSARCCNTTDGNPKHQSTPVEIKNSCTWGNPAHKKDDNPGPKSAVRHPLRKIIVIKDRAQRLITQAFLYGHRLQSREKCCFGCILLCE